MLKGHKLFQNSVGNCFLKIKGFLLLGSEAYLEIISFLIFTDKLARIMIVLEACVKAILRGMNYSLQVWKNCLVL